MASLSDIRGVSNIVCGFTKSNTVDLLYIILLQLTQGHIIDTKRFNTITSITGLLSLEKNYYIYYYITSHEPFECLSTTTTFPKIYRFINCFECLNVTKVYYTVFDMSRYIVKKYIVHKLIHTLIQ